MKLLSLFCILQVGYSPSRDFCVSLFFSACSHGRLIPVEVVVGGSNLECGFADVHSMRQKDSFLDLEEFISERIASYEAFPV